MQEIYIKAICTKIDENLNLAIKGLRIWIGNTYCDHYVDRKGNSYFFNYPLYQINKIDSPFGKPFTYDLDNLIIEKPLPRLNLNIES